MMVAEITFASVCMVLLSMIFWIIRRLFKQKAALDLMIHNDVVHMQESLSSIDTKLAVMMVTLAGVVNRLDRLQCGGCPHG